MTPQWDSLPLLPLRCVLDHLSVEDALAAMSTCRHWRNAILLYEGHKDTLKLQAKEMKKTMFLTRIFRRYTNKLHIYLDGSEDELEKLMNFVVPQYFDAVELKELIFVGPSYLHQNQHMSLIKLKRIVTESLLFKNIHCIDTFALLGCELDDANDDDKDLHKHIEYYSRGLLFSHHSIMSVVNLDIHDFASNLRHIILEYTQISTMCLVSMEPLRQLRFLTLNITGRREPWPRVDWRLVQRAYSEPLQITINIIAVPYRRFNDIMDNVLVEGLNLISLKVMFCKSIYTPLLAHVSRLYQETLREVVWADSPYESNDPYHRIVRPLRQIQQLQPDQFAHVNPFVLLCWQCIQLRRLAIHGYWVWHYDLLGFVRLRKTLTELDISAIYSKQYDNEVQMSEEGVVRVMVNDRPSDLDTASIDEVNEYTEFDWLPTPWGELPPGLRGRSTEEQRAEYLIAEAQRTPGGSLY